MNTSASMESKALSTLKRRVSELIAQGMHDDAKKAVRSAFSCAAMKKDEELQRALCSLATFVVFSKTHSRMAS